MRPTSYLIRTRVDRPLLDGDRLPGRVAALGVLACARVPRDRHSQTRRPRWEPWGRQRVAGGRLAHRPAGGSSRLRKGRYSGSACASCLGDEWVGLGPRRAWRRWSAMRFRPSFMEGAARPLRPHSGPGRAWRASTRLSRSASPAECLWRIQRADGWTMALGMLGLLVYLALASSHPGLYVVWAGNAGIMMWKHRGDLRDPVRLRVPGHASGTPRPGD